MIIRKRPVFLSGIALVAFVGSLLILNTTQASNNYKTVARTGYGKLSDSENGDSFGAHLKHSGFACTVCHKAVGRVVFDENGPAFSPNSPKPTFDAVVKTCTSVACHSIPAGTFSYYFQGGDGEPVLNTVNYGGGASRTTPSWYATGAIGCTACHDDPPRNGAWHSGLHGNQSASGVRNQCQFCHPDASSPNNGIGDTITNPSLHANGTVNVQAAFTSQCFGCH